MARCALEIRPRRQRPKAPARACIPLGWEALSIGASRLLSLKVSCLRVSLVLFYNTCTMTTCVSLHTLADSATAVGPCGAATVRKRLRAAAALHAQPTLCACRPAVSGHISGLSCCSSAPPEQSSRTCCREAGPAVLPRHAAHGLGAWCVSALVGLEPAAAAVHAEPANALSLPTWAIHVSSTVEWGAAMYLVWRYAEVTGGRPAVALCAQVALKLACAPPAPDVLCTLRSTSTCHAWE